MKYSILIIIYMLQPLSYLAQASEGIYINHQQVKVINHLDKCLSIQIKGIRQCGQTTKLSIRAKTLNEMYTCGCISRYISYRVEEVGPIDDQTLPFQRAWGVLLATDSVGKYKLFDIPVKSDADIVYNGAVFVHLGCKGPD